MFSSENGEASNSRSSKITDAAIKTYEDVTKKPIPHKEKVRRNWNYVIRKIAHFSLYFVLGILVFLWLREYSLTLAKTVLFSLLFCLCYALTDEAHQLLSLGRSGRLMDVFIDFSGSFVSILIFTFFYSRH